ncbi:hypothetical protein D9611_006457 [Ephemerocybe angulata]|uniref:Amidohydrolase-related domain-containing protein n=1 Tax=Ephemerocybe angulata TaxID=980116 RepID=A0A8H5C7K1_9AGAR|nr:hypothetical protein D9611_006457 [Tulosesus angulatus]
MKTSTFLSLFTSVLLSSASIVSAQDPPANITEVVLDNAAADSIDLSALDPSIFNGAFAEIKAVYEQVVEVESSGSDASTARRRALRYNRRADTRKDIIDVHTHAVPSWFKQLVPVTGGNPTPDWTLEGHIAFMDQQGIDKSIIAISAPHANVFQGQKAVTVALARVLNEAISLYCRAYPTRLNFYAVVPLPYTTEAIAEAKYAINTLGAKGIVLTSNHEGTYLGNAQFTPFFKAINELGGRRVLYIHPGTPYVKVGNQLVEANPTPYPTGNIEFYFETARTLMDLTLTQTIHNFTNIHYVIPHVGGAFPAALDRILKSAPAIYDSSLAIYNTRFWWDSAGPTYYHQISGLLGIGVPKSQLLFGTDFPYAPIFTQAGSLAAVKNSPLFTDTEKTAIFKTNAQNLFQNQL